MSDDRIFLPDVTLVALDNGVASDLTLHAIADTSEKIRCRESILFYEFANAEEELWKNVGPKVQTSHLLLIQYDSWVLDATLWRPFWLEFDYIGAPWPWKKERRVGNGGFSLRSSRLMQFLAAHADEFPVKHPEDHTLCHVYRPALEQLGFRWAPESVAHDFAFEREPPHTTFGFHGIFNWPHVLSEEELSLRRGMATPYVRAKSEWREIAT